MGVGRTLLSDAFDVVLVWFEKNRLDRSSSLRQEQGVGQEFPTHMVRACASITAMVTSIIVPLRKRD